MAAMFTPVVRTPLTGVLSILEMTNGTNSMVPLMAACLTATSIATLLKRPPIYDTLRKPRLGGQRDLRIDLLQCPGCGAAPIPHQ